MSMASSSTPLHQHFHLSTLYTPNPQSLGGWQDESKRKPIEKHGHPGTATLLRLELSGKKASSEPVDENGI